jgi:hypothetical protein
MRNRTRKTSPFVLLLLLLFLCALCASCSQSAKYALHEGTDPENGTRTTLRIDTTTGEAWQLAKIPANGGTLSLWRPILERDTAIKAAALIQKELTNATNSNFTY